MQSSGNLNEKIKKLKTKKILVGLIHKEKNLGLHGV